MSLHGDWKRALAWLHPTKNKRKLNEAAREMLKEVGDFGAKLMRARILGGQVGGPGLSNVTKSHKSQQGLDARKLIATGAYVFSIRRKMEGDYAVVVGPPPKFAKLARWLEFGTNKMPARPHFRPAYREMKAEAKRIGKRHGFEMK